MSKYKESGVDNNKGNNFISSINPKVKKKNIPELNSIFKK